MKFDKVVLIIICAHLEICTKRISSLRLGVYKPIFTEPNATFCVHCRRCALALLTVGFPVLLQLNGSEFLMA